MLKLQIIIIVIFGFTFVKINSLHNLLNCVRVKNEISLTFNISGFNNIYGDFKYGEGQIIPAYAPATPFTYIEFISPDIDAAYEKRKTTLFMLNIWIKTKGVICYIVCSLVNLNIDQLKEGFSYYDILQQNKLIPYYVGFLSTSMTGKMYIYATIYRQKREIFRSTDFDSSNYRILNSVRHVKKILDVKGNVGVFKFFEAYLEMKN
ncbi:uncharacterized protein LOC142332973 isoform X1 [Lycorma delicatula]|uniref:uncharacterized protein LOC142332973 isoform X1 n=1 Tax=Lycorma delicatula TaxID=130591 RepID=UPI003F518259